LSKACPEPSEGSTIFSTHPLSLIKLFKLDMSAALSVPDDLADTILCAGGATGQVGQ
jgi:hypothetical protein